MTEPVLEDVKVPAGVRPELSIHARRRFRERARLPARALRRAAYQALHEGRSLNEIPDYARNRLVRMAANHADKYVEDQRFARVYRGHAYIFARKTDGGFMLVTVLPNFETPEDITEDSERRGATRSDWIDGYWRKRRHR